MSVPNPRAGTAPRMLVAFASLIGAGASWAAPPAAPQVTFGAGEIKQLRFDWDIVPRSNYYEFWFKADNGSPYVKFAENKPWQPRALSNISAHLLDWNQARYLVKACNFSGCTSSIPIPVSGVVLDTVGYVKSTRNTTYGQFGSVVDVSEDGSTMVALAANEKAFVPGFYPEREGVLGIYVYRQKNHHWIEEAILQPSNVQQYTGGRATASISGDGNVIAVGVPDDQVIDPATETTTARGGAVYIFRRSGSNWQLETRLTPCNCLAADSFGSRVDLDETGHRLSIARTSGGGASSSGTVAIHEYSVGNWPQKALIPAAAGDACPVSALSGDGKTLVRKCSHAGAATRVQLYAAPDWQLRETLALDSVDSTAQDIAVDYSGATILTSWRNAGINGHSTLPTVVVYRGTAAHHASQAQLMGGAWNIYLEKYGEHLAVSRDGTYLAVTDEWDSGIEGGVSRPPLTPTAPEDYARATGAVYIYERKPSGWNLRRVVKPNKADTVDNIGHAVAFGANGHILAVGEPSDRGTSNQIGGDQTYQESPDAGAVWLY